ncbi:hypothetical protein AB0C13_41290 [Streptomyces sp. NPDC049099]|uniref:hypothetical protein n=1 Tax=Streptomyces sp. NPDC049099 TaxID=3155768 RepID=UPI0034319BFA
MSSRWDATRASEISAGWWGQADHHLAITRKAVTALADRTPAQATSPDLPEHPDYPCMVTLFHEATGPLRARDICEALDHKPLPKNIEGTRAKLKGLVKLGILTKAGAGGFTRKQ